MELKTCVRFFVLCPKLMLYNFFVIESLRLKHLERLQYSNTLNNSSDKGKEYNVLTRLQVTRSPQKQWG